MHRFGRLGGLTTGVTLAVALAGVCAGPALASPVTSQVLTRPETSSPSPITSGYAAVPPSGSSMTFTHVQVAFTVPTVNCTSVPNGTAQMRAGLDGVGNATVERVGLSETCTNGAASYSTWYQMYPAAAVTEFTPKPGDALNYNVTFASGAYTLSIKDVTSGESFTVTRLCADTCQNASAQVMAGTPASGVAPANFTAVNYSTIIVTNSAGVSGGLSNAAWNTVTFTQTGSPNTVAGPLSTSSSPPQSAFQDTWNA